MRLNNHSIGKEKYKTMIVDDDPGIIDAVKVVLDSDKYFVYGCTDPSEAIEKIQEEHFDLLILDYLLKQTTGKKVVEDIRRFNTELYILLLTGYKDMAPPLESLRSLDIQAYCEKGDRLEQLTVIVESAIKSIDMSRRLFYDGMRSVLSFVPDMYKLRPVNNLVNDIFLQFLQITKSNKGFFLISGVKDIKQKENIKSIKGSGLFDKSFDELYEIIIEEFTLDIEKLFKKNEIIFGQDFVFLPLISAQQDEYIVIGIECEISNEMKDLLKVFLDNAESSYNNAILYKNNNVNNDLSLIIHELGINNKKWNKMRIAVIEEYETLRLDLAKLLGHEWDIEFFRGPVDFEKVQLGDYDVIISDSCLISERNKEFFEKILAESEAELLLIGDQFEQEIVKNDRINGLIKRDDLSSIVDYIKYISTKLSIQRAVQKDIQGFSDIKNILAIDP